MTVRLLEKLPFSLIPLGNYLKTPSFSSLIGETDRWPGRQASSIIKKRGHF
jgi:hypothetical protein